MKILLLSFILSINLHAVQTPVPTTGNAKTTAACSPANTGSGNRFVINCGIGKEQGQQMITILNTILANQLSSDAVMKKLDEILKNINPNREITTYDCGGLWTRRSPGVNVGEDLSIGGSHDDYDEMIGLVNKKQVSELITKCELLLIAKPEWETPRLFCSYGYYRKGDIAKAREFLKIYDVRIGPAYEDQHCKERQQYLHKVMP